eukprot:TRINITY_DN19924_c0_g2_i1.p1 TRINITY_DN19924_c0_g2~~TRINITY_DN19924_c0_g2_i1.p1  ORF type:complete len:1439 (-),score=217.03 TRINITY_DN19924_c0_g2_i1:231-4340(-)
MGQLSLSLAYGGCLVVSEASDPLALRQVVEGERVDVLGLVPDQLAFIAQEPARELPWVRLLLSWAEKLPPHIARRWADHPRAVFRELLIATEYWLTLYAEPLGSEPARMCPVRGARVVALRPPEEPGAETGASACSSSSTPLVCGEVGELCMAGSMVTPGYLDVGGATSSSASPFAEVCGERYFRTGDLVRVVPGGFVFVGRKDMLTKEKGQWVDMTEVETRLQGLENVREARIIADPQNPSMFHAFAALSVERPVLLSGGEASSQGSSFEALRKVKASLPQRVSLHILPALPRNVATRKIDLAELKNILALGQPKSWPISVDSKHDSGVGVPPDFLRERLLTKASRQGCWTGLLFTVGMFGGLLGAFRSRKASDESRLWQGWNVFPVGLFTLPYMFLATVYIDERSSLVALVRDEIPFGRFGLMLGLHASRSLFRPAHILLHAWAFGGLCIATIRKRPISWIVAFWCGAGHQADRECDYWLYAGNWYRHSLWVAQRCRRSLSLPFQYTASFTFQLISWRAPSSEVTESSCLGLVDAESPPLNELNVELLSKNKSESNGKEIATTDVGCMLAGDTEALSHDQNCDQGPCHDSAEREQPQAENGAKADAAAAEDEDAEKSEENAELQRWHHDMWWWYNCTETYLDVPEGDVEVVRAATKSSVNAPSAAAALGGLGCGGAPTAAGADRPAEAQRLLGLLEQADPSLQPANLDTPLSGLDSLRVTLLASLIQVELGISLTASRIQGASTPRELLSVLKFEDAAQADSSEATPSSCSQARSGEREFAVWWSPGQHTPMGAWVLRSDVVVDHELLLAATQWLIDRHSACRSVRADPLRFMSFMYDTAVLSTLYLPSLPRFIQKVVGWGLSRAWPRIAVRERARVYPEGWGNTPLEVIEILDGQDALERAFDNRRWSFKDKPPFDIALFELKLHLVGGWDLHNEGRVEISEAEHGAPGTGINAFHYHHVEYGHRGQLVGPNSPEWLPPPYAFPALFCVRLDDGGVVWLRFEQRNILKVVWKPDTDPNTRYMRCWGTRASAIDGEKESEQACKLTTLSYLFVQIFHCYADGYCYYPLVGDLLDAYHRGRFREDPQCATEAAGNQLAHPVREFIPPRRPRPPEAYLALQGRLFDTLRSRLGVPDRHSLRGSIWRYSGEGYGHHICVQGVAHEVLSLCASRYAIPFDYLLLSAIILAVARAGGDEKVEMTLYVPMRDGHEASVVGLFADWRDIAVAVPCAHATVLGVAVQVADILRQRRWAVYNALRKPERTVVNFMPLDPQSRGHFRQLEDGQWTRSGDTLGHRNQRGNDLEWTNQPLRFDLVQEHPTAWWIKLGCEYAAHPPPWTRRFLRALEDFIPDLALQPTTLAHKPYPDEFY